MIIIGIRILKETPKVVRKCLYPGWYPFVDTKLVELNDEVWPDYIEHMASDTFFKLDDNDKLKINISAIVGKNGTGKSTIAELLLAIINNISAKLITINNQDFIYKSQDTYVRNIYADLFYELDDRIYCIQIRDQQISIIKKYGETGKEVRLSEEVMHKIVVKDFLNKFFYTVSINYGLHSFNSDNVRNHVEKWNNIHRNLWFDHYFHRVDGYSIPLTLVPDRNKGVIDINKEEELTRKRLAKIALWLHVKGHKPLVEGYKPVRLIWFRNKWKDKETILLIQRLLFNKELNDAQLKRCDELYLGFRKYWISQLNNQSKSIDEDIFLSAINYLTYKTIKICVNYPTYGNLLFKYNTTVYNYKNIGKIVDMLMMEQSHIATKIRATISFLSSELYTSKKQSAYIQEIIPLLNGKKNLEEIEMILPPPFFSYDIEYSKYGEKEDLVTLDDLSSGEKQMAFILSAAMEHLANLSSIPTKDINRVAYHHVNLIFDEAELYFHPEFQRTFIHKLISILSSGFIDKRRIRTINVLIVTHSPYLLSDIPGQNILFLDENGSHRKEPTFAANIYDLLKEGFFMNSGIGAFAAMKINRILQTFQDPIIIRRKQKYLINRNDFWFTASIIGDHYIKENIKNVLTDMDSQYTKEGNQQ